MTSLINKIYRKLCDTALPFLIFLIGMVNVKLYFKIVALLFYIIYVAYKKYELPKKSIGVTIFYFVMPFIGIIAPLLNYNNIASIYWLGYLWGLVSWVVAGFSFYLILATVINVRREKLLNAIDLFFALNIVVSVIQLIIVMFMAHSIMPYWIWDSAEKFGVSTGDNIYGISFNNSITNSAISAIGIVYYLFNNKRSYAIVCALILLLSTSNFSIIIILFVLMAMFIFSNKKLLRKNIVYVFIAFLFYPLLSPTNITYVGTIYNKFVKSNYAYNKRKERNHSWIGNVGQNYAANNSKVFGGEYNISLLKDIKISSDTSTAKNSNLKLDPYYVRNYFYVIYGLKTSNTPLAKYSRPGKVYSFHQTIAFLQSDYRNLVFGAGTARFSSKQAIKMTGLGLQGNYPPKYVYASPEFFQYHLYTILYFLSQDISVHSILNFPDSVYNQIAGEYGLIGIIAFTILYIGYFWKHRKKYHYGLYLLILVLLFFGFEYWFEMISITVIFELLMLLDIFAPPNTNATATTSNSINARV